jgi:hypothetical protein
MDMKIIGCLLVIGILFSYVPVFSMDECPEGNHLGNMRMDCGVPFHCPMIVDIIISETSNLPLNGLFISIRTYLYVDELAHPIFHPPEYLSTILFPGDEGGKIIKCATMGHWHKNCPLKLQSLQFLS